MKENRKLLLSFLLGIALLGLLTECQKKQDSAQKNLLNFNHLNHLYQTIHLKNQLVGILHIYSEAPDYRWVAAKGEGITCLDDNARAAVLYLRQFQATGQEKYFQKARLLLRFVRAMQAPDGLFYNFLLPDLRVNKTRANSTNRLDFWTARAVWALGEGFAVAQNSHSQLADSLRESLKRVLPAIRKIAANYPKTETISGHLYPTWLINRYAADATSELLLGLAAYGQASADSTVIPLVQKLSEGLLLMQWGNWNQMPFAAHLSFPKIWHGWGNAQSEALSKAGQWLHEARFTDSARKEADWFFSRLLIDGWKSSLILNDTVEVHTFPQIAYEVRPVALGLENLSKSTGEKKYAILAGLAGSWLLGNNAAGKAMYDQSTGRCFDGIENPTKINKNSGAESTIEALLTLQALQNDSVARKYLFYLTRSEAQTVKKDGEIIYKYRRYSDKEKSVIIYLNLQNGQMDVVSEQAWQHLIREEKKKNGGDK